MASDTSSSCDALAPPSTDTNVADIPKEIWDTLPPEMQESLQGKTEPLQQIRRRAKAATEPTDETRRKETAGDAGADANSTTAAASGTSTATGTRTPSSPQHTQHSVHEVKDVIQRHQDDDEVMRVILEISLVRGLCYAYRCFFQLQRLFARNEIVNELFDDMTAHLAPVLQHIYKHANQARTSSAEINDTLHNTLKELYTTDAHSRWLPPLQFDTITQLERPAREEDCPVNVLTRKQREDWCEYCSKVFSRFVNSYSHEVVYAKFTDRFVTSPVFRNYFSSRKNPGQRLQLERMMARLREKRYYEYKELYNLYQNVLSSFAFNRIIFTGTQEQAYCRLLKLLFRDMGSMSGSNESPFGEEMMKRVMNIAKHDDELKRLYSNMSQKRVQDFQDQLSFLFSNFSQNSMFQDMVNSPMMQQLQTMTGTSFTSSGASPSDA